MGWEGHLELRWRRDGERTVAHDRHSGPLRVLRRLYPEGDTVCHQVLVHPPGGIAGGDRLAVEATLGPGAHALVTTPGATRFYRSNGDTAWQTVDATLEDGARLEWLPLETIAYAGCLADNRLRFELRGGAQMFGWDLLALGLPASGEPFERGRFAQRIELPGLWLESGVIDGSDRLLRESPLGLAGHPVMATLWLASGTPLARGTTESLIDAARTRIDAGAPMAGVTSPDARLVVLRALAPRVEPAQALLRDVWALWRTLLWNLPACPPRVWST